jgi:hypothetical protein
MAAPESAGTLVFFLVFFLLPTVAAAIVLMVKYLAKRNQREAEDSQASPSEDFNVPRLADAEEQAKREVDLAIQKIGEHSKSLGQLRQDFRLLDEQARRIGERLGALEAEFKHPATATPGASPAQTELADDFRRPSARKQDGNGS